MVLHIFFRKGRAREVAVIGPRFELSANIVGCWLTIDVI